MNPNFLVQGKFSCELCHYITCRKSQYDRHLSTPKHINILEKIQNDTNMIQIVPKLKTTENVCKCGKVYKHQSGLWRHKKSCEVDKNKQLSNKAFLEHFNENMTDKDLIMYLLKENKEFKELILNQSNMMLEIVNKPSTVNNNNIQSTNTNTNLAGNPGS